MGLVDRNEVLRQMQNSRTDCPYEGQQAGAWKVAHDCCISIVESVAAIEAEPVRHGRWIPIDESETVCSECGKHCCFDQNIDGSVDDYIFCPHCGARMDLKPHEETEDKPTNDFINNRFNTVY